MNKKLKDAAYYQANKDRIKARTKAYYEAHKAQILEAQSKWIKANPEKHAAYVKKWAGKNKDTTRAACRKWHRENPWVAQANNAKRRAARLKATPPWADLEKIKQIYEKRPKGHHVDHIIPLQGRNVCGLHVHYNLQYLPAEENQRKYNK